MISDKKIIKEVANLNKEIYQNKLSILNFGNAGFIDRKKQKIYIKGTGFDTKDINENKISIVGIKKNKIVRLNKIKPSVDVSIYLSIIKKFKKIKFIAHSHSTFATILAQLNLEPECVGTTHADFFYDKVPLSLKIDNINNKNYENKIANSIIERIRIEKFFPPGILIRNHGAMVWADTAKKTLNNLIAIEKICELYYYSKLVGCKKISKELHHLHYFRKNGKNKYYGQ